MDSFIKNIKKKLSVDNLVDMMKDSKVIDENAIKEEDVRSTLKKLDPNSLMDLEEITAKLNEISDEINNVQAKPETSTATKIIEAAKASLAKMSCGEKEKAPPASNENEYLSALGKEDNVFNLYDDFH